MWGTILFCTQFYSPESKAVVQCFSFRVSHELTLCILTHSVHITCVSNPNFNAQITQDTPKIECNSLDLKPHAYGNNSFQASSNLHPGNRNMEIILGHSHYFFLPCCFLASREVQSGHSLESYSE